MRQRITELLVRPWVWFLAYLCWFALLFFLSEQASFGPKRETFPHSDKVAHAVYFSTGATALGVAILLRRPGCGRAALIAVLMGCSLAVGCFDEWHQSFTPGRDGNSPGDIAADVLGGAIGFFVASWLFGFAGRKGILQRSAP